MRSRLPVKHPTEVEQVLEGDSASEKSRQSTSLTVSFLCAHIREARKARKEAKARDPEV